MLTGKSRTRLTRDVIRSRHRPAPLRQDIPGRTGSDAYAGEPRQRNLRSVPVPLDDDPSADGMPRVGKLRDYDGGFKRWRKRQRVARNTADSVVARRARQEPACILIRAATIGLGRVDEIARLSSAHPPSGHSALRSGLSLPTPFIGQLSHILPCSSLLPSELDSSDR
jgi:hypothetical protein